MVSSRCWRSSSSQGLQVLGLALADDLHPARLDVGVVAGEGEARLLHPRVGDPVVEVATRRRGPRGGGSRSSSPRSSADLDVRLFAVHQRAPPLRGTAQTAAGSRSSRMRSACAGRALSQREIAARHLQVLGRRRRSGRRPGRTAAPAGRPRRRSRTPPGDHADRHDRLARARGSLQCGMAMPVPIAGRAELLALPAACWKRSSALGRTSARALGDPLGERAQDRRVGGPAPGRSGKISSGRVERRQTHTATVRPRRSACGRSRTGCSARRGTWPRCGGRSGCLRG